MIAMRDVVTENATETVTETVPEIETVIEIVTEIETVHTLDTMIVEAITEARDIVPEEEAVTTDTMIEVDTGVAGADAEDSEVEDVINSKD